MPFVFQPPPREQGRSPEKSPVTENETASGSESTQLVCSRLEAQRCSRNLRMHVSGEGSKLGEVHNCGDATHQGVCKSVASDSVCSYDFMSEAEKMVTDLCNSSPVTDLEESEELEKIINKTCDLQAFANCIRILNNESKSINTSCIFKTKYVMEGVPGVNCCQHQSHALRREDSAENSSVCCQADLLHGNSTELSFPEKIAKLTEEICQNLNAMPPSATVSGISKICNEAKMYFDESDQFRCTSKSELKNIVLAFLQLAYSWLYLSSENGLQDIIHFFHPALKEKFAKWKHITKAVLDSMINVILDNNRSYNRINRNESNYSKVDLNTAEYSSDKSSTSRDFTLSSQSSVDGSQCQSSGILGAIVMGYNQSQPDVYEFRPAPSADPKYWQNNIAGRFPSAGSKDSNDFASKNLVNGSKSNKSVVGSGNYRANSRPSQGEMQNSPKQNFSGLRIAQKKYNFSNVGHAIGNNNQSRGKVSWNNNKHFSGAFCAKGYQGDPLENFGKYFQNYRCDTKNIFQKLSNMEQKYYAPQAEHSKSFGVPVSESEAHGSQQQEDDGSPWMLPCYNLGVSQYGPSPDAVHKPRSRYLYPDFKNKVNVHKRHVPGYMPKKVTKFGSAMHTLIDSDSSDDTRDLVYMKPGSYNVPMKPRKRFSAKSRLANHVLAMQNLEDACDSICSSYVQTWKTSCNPRKKHQTDSTYVQRKYTELPPIDGKQVYSITCSLLCKIN